mmetsp:Transcript_1825/g.3172  ORF Transcript_1825/g.3172 Transcript_1825/m.3172 type:complete len:482 (-) Transcript_1825:243-1688(-)|eukprot:CAMPEP_0184693150 /NCGR_PEP_ID=MMETSP0313-20130426/1432_1 /TAXON_ID=2792 /ORGANISM="Porphyridium aerugineum, Strain SAG 1380-2" /LENGTH=481 /DNA_ID=CAMNT_0027151133 /DNA_START=173 /DNA_END=1618 /DNA_ORIENTATION=-
MGVFKDVITAAARPDEALAMLRYKLKATAAQKASMALRKSSDPLSQKWEFCYDYLKKVSRSFALVIMELDDELRDPVCIFYLVLRGLDTVEDDTSVDAQKRIELCTSFHTYLTQRGYKTDEYGHGYSKELLEQFDIVIDCFLSLKPAYQEVIADITARMGAGMAEHIHDKECITIKEYDQYCFYVAGLVGLGLSSMFVASGREDKFFIDNERLSVSMGLFLQKTNIIRDYLEDIHDARTFWPKEIWSKFAPHGSLADFKDEANRFQAVECLNAMVSDAMRHVPDCIEYMSHIRNQHVFNFVAIPQVMAIGTLSECFNNPRVFEGVVKLRRGLTAKMILKTKTMSALFKCYFDFATIMEKKCQPADPSYDITIQRLRVIEDLSLPYIPATPDLLVPNWIVVIVFALVTFYLIQRRRYMDLEGLVISGVPAFQDMAAMAVMFLCVAYMLVFFGLQFMKPTIVHVDSNDNLVGVADAAEYQRIN